MTTIEIITLISSMATLITSIATIFIVLEMKKQRLTSHKPLLKFVGKYSKANIDKFKQWSWEDEKIELFNFGSGPAIDITINWIANENKLIKLLKKYAQNSKDYDINHNTLLKLKNETHITDRQKSIKIPAISTFDTSKSPTEIRIPGFIISSFSHYINETLLNEEKSTPTSSELKVLKFDDFIPITIEVSYKDIDNNLYSQKFEFKIHPIFLSNPKDKKNGYANILFETREIP